MHQAHQLEERLLEMEKVAQAFQVAPFDIYLLGGAACLLAGYTSRATRDFDLVDQQYSASLAKVLVFLRDYDLLEYESTLLSPHYKDRCRQLTSFQYLNIYTLSAEDIIVSKLVRLNERDWEDLDAMMPQANHPLIFQIIEEVLQREDLYETKKEGLRRHLKSFKEKYHVSDTV
ncbi:MULTISPECIES: DUF6036 family nucleotidyltransferase [Anoxynatronum]|uniref:DUF6036 domain-containing protein n=2 Tax=Anoxynatronum TaxID=210622 RepID=A0AA46AKH4_9CLOT|nr:DUF6036 family nucleotidyltransferase [Anoxynatronum buryatiense]SMP71068.1 hypothetical protein SAMN06296020_1227 [Anoxynatronum buryatiense]